MINRIPLTVKEPSGVERKSYPVTSGIPMPKGVLLSSQEVRLLNQAGEEIPVQTETMAMWIDGSVKWMLVDFQANLKPNEMRTYYLEYGDKVKRTACESICPHSVEVSETGSRIDINTNAIKCRISKEKFNLFDAVFLDGE